MANLFQKECSQNKGYQGIGGRPDTWQEVREFGPERMREDVGPAVLWP
jgi:hypothetical protein